MQDMSREPAAVIQELSSKARIVRTACGDGEMVWRVWGEGQPVVLFHGGSGSWNHWFKTIPALTAAGYQAIAADLPGLGDSAMPAEPHVPASVAAAVMRGLESDILPGRAEPHLVGFSFGGHIAGLTAKGMGPAFRDLTLVGVAALGLPHREGRPLAKYRSTMTPAEMLEVDRQNLGILMIHDTSAIDDLALQLHSENLRKARFRSAPFAPGDELKRALADVRVPLKTIWGKQDVIAMPTMEVRLAVLAEHHPELRAKLIDNAGHWVMYEQGEAFAAALLELLSA